MTTQLPQANAGPEFPCSHEQREIPRNNLAHDADGLAQSVGVELAARRVGHADGNGVALDLGGPARHVMEQIRRERNIRDARHDARLAVVVSDSKFGQFVGVLKNKIADAPDDFAARSLGVIFDHGPDSKARRAAATARLMSSLSLSGTRAMTDASAGLNTSNSCPEAAGDHLPPMRFSLGFLSQAAVAGLIFECERAAEVSPL